MTVSYDEAMVTLTAMFEDVDKEVIAMILESYNGHMEKTVEQLLIMTDQADGSEVVNHGTGGGGDGNVPADFLGPGGGQDLQQIEQDAMLAKMMQDEMFLDDLRNNEEFRSQLDNDNLGGYQRGSLSRTERSGSQSGGSEPSFTERLKTMGEATKKKFAELAENFRSRKPSGSGGDERRGSKARYQTLGTDDDDALGFGSSAAASADTLHSRRGRHADDDDEDGSSLQDRRVHRATELGAMGGPPSNKPLPAQPSWDSEEEDVSYARNKKDD